MSENQEEHNHQQHNSTNKALSDQENMKNSSLEGGILYCKRISEQLENELKNWQDKLENIKRKNKILKKCSTDLDIEKEQLVTRFHEEMRKYDVMEKCISKLEEEIQNTTEFLKFMTGLEEDIKDSKMHESRIRTYVSRLLQENFSDFETFQNILTIQINGVQKKINEANCYLDQKKFFSAMNCELKTYINICKEKIDNLKTLTNTENFTEQIREKILRIKIERETEANEVTNKIGNFLRMMKSEIDNLLHLQLNPLKERVKSEYFAKCTRMNKLKNELKNDITSIKNINFEILNEKNETENLRRGKENKLSEFDDIKLKVKSAKEEKEKVIHSQLKLMTEVQDLQSIQQIYLKKIEECKLTIQNSKTANEALKYKLEELIRLSNSETKLMDCIKLQHLKKERYIELKETTEKINSEKNHHLNEIENLKNQIEQENERIRVLKVTLSNIKNNTTNILKNSEEQNLLNIYSCIETEENSSNELAEFEINSINQKLFDIVFKKTDLEMYLSQILKENLSLDDEIKSKCLKLKNIHRDNELCKMSIQKLKQNVYQGKYITQQELNKKYNIMVNGKNVETEKITKLNEEIKTLTNRLNSKMENKRFEETSLVEKKSYS